MPANAAQEVSEVREPLKAFVTPNVVYVSEANT